MKESNRSELTRRGFLAASAGALATTALPRLARADDAPEKKLGWAIVGIGNLSRGQLLPGLTKTKNARLAALVSGHPDKAKATAEQYKLDPKHIYNYDNFEKMADDPDIDVVYIVLPNGMHAEYTIRAAKIGKHVFCEKPMANTAADCQQMIDACKSAKKMLGIGYRMQYEPHMVEAKRLIKAGEIGKVTRVESEFGFNATPGVWRLNKKLAGGGPLMDVGIYSLNSTRFVLGEEPAEVSATIPDANGDERFKEVEPAMDFELTFPSGVVAKCKTSYREFPGVGLRIFGEAGNLQMNPAFSYSGNLLGIQHGSERPTMFIPKTAVGDQFATEMDDFSRCIIDGKPTRTPGEEGLADMKAIEALYKAAADKKAVKV
jgi:predicted dehydrogenase